MVLCRGERQPQVLTRSSRQPSPDLLPSCHVPRPRWETRRPTSPGAQRARGHTRLGPNLWRPGPALASLHDKDAHFSSQGESGRPNKLLERKGITRKTTASFLVRGAVGLARPRARGVKCGVVLSTRMMSALTEVPGGADAQL